MLEAGLRGCVVYVAAGTLERELYVRGCYIRYTDLVLLNFAS